MKTISKDNKEGSVSILLFGAILGTVSSTLLHTSRGKQLVHDAQLVFDDLVSLVEHVLDDDVSFENSIEGVRVFGEHAFDKLERVAAFSPSQTVHSAPQAVPEPVIPVHVPTAPLQASSPSAFLYHRPVEAKKNVVKKKVDDEISLLQQIGKSLYR